MKMSPALTEIIGIGDATAETLRAYGFDSPADLAGAAIGDIVRVPGFGYQRAQQVRNRAKDLVDAAAEVGAVEPPVSGPAAAEPSEPDPEPESAADGVVVSGDIPVAPVAESEAGSEKVDNKANKKLGAKKDAGAKSNKAKPNKVKADKGGKAAKSADKKSGKKSGKKSDKKADKTKAQKKPEPLAKDKKGAKRAKKAKKKK